MIETLEKDLKKYYIEMQKQTSSHPNNHTLNRIIAFFDLHHTKIKGLVDEYKAQDGEPVL